MNYASHLGCHFTDSDGKHIRNFQLLIGGIAVACADFEDGDCVRFLFADSHAKEAKTWRKSFKWNTCGQCGGNGKQSEYGETWPCPFCDGKGGFISD